MESKIGICVVSLYDAQYLYDFTTWCKQVGFDKLVIYDANPRWGESPVKILGRLVEDGFVHVIDCRGDYQLAVRKHEFMEGLEDCTWGIRACTDEYLMFTMGNAAQVHSVHEWLDRDVFRDASTIIVNHLVVGDNGKMSNDDTDLIRAFPNAMNPETLNYHVVPKYINQACSIVKRMVLQEGVQWHSVDCNGHYKAAMRSGDGTPFTNEVVYDTAFIVKFYTKTILDWIINRTRAIETTTKCHDVSQRAHIYVESLLEFFAYNAVDINKSEVAMKVYDAMFTTASKKVGVALDGRSVGEDMMKLAYGVHVGSLCGIPCTKLLVHGISQAKAFGIGEDLTDDSNLRLTSANVYEYYDGMADDLLEQWHMLGYSLYLHGRAMVPIDRAECIALFGEKLQGGPCRDLCGCVSVDFSKYVCIDVDVAECGMDRLNEMKQKFPKTQKFIVFDQQLAGPKDIVLDKQKLEKVHTKYGNSITRIATIAMCKGCIITLDANRMMGAVLNETPKRKVVFHCMDHEIRNCIPQKDGWVDIDGK